MTDRNSPWPELRPVDWEIDLLPDGTIGLRLNGHGAAEELKLHAPKPVRWLRDYGAYSLPLQWESCTAARLVADKYNRDLIIGADLRKWAAEEKVRRESIPDVNSFELVELQRVSQETPRLWKALQDRPFQTVGAAFAANNRNALIADDPGLGKTLQSIGAVVEAGIKGVILVVAPKAAVYDTWPREIAQWAPEDKAIIVGAHQKPAERRAVLASLSDVGEPGKCGNPDRVWILTTPNYLRIKAVVDEYGKYVYGPKREKQYKVVREGLSEFFEIDWATVIVDESHKMLACGTGNAKKFSAQRQGLDLLTVRNDGLRIALSGTPFRGKREFAYGTLNWLRPDLYTGYWPWAKRFFDVYHDGYGMITGRLLNEDAFYEDLRKVMVRRTKSEVAKDLPPKSYPGSPLDPHDPNSPHAVWLSMDDAQAKAYEQMTALAMAELDDGDLMANGILAIMTRLKQFACSAANLVGENDVQPKLPSNKFDWLVEWFDERGLNADATQAEVAAVPKVIVSSQFSKLLTLFSDELGALGIKTHLFTGDTNDKKRKAIIADWQNNPDSDVRVLLLTITAGGTSLTLDAADDVVLLDETWVPDDTTQLEDRAHRLSRTDHKVTIWKLKTLGTIEEGIARVLHERDEGIRDVLDRTRGVETARELIGVKR